MGLKGDIIQRAKYVNLRLRKFSYFSYNNEKYFSKLAKV